MSQLVSQLQSLFGQMNVFANIELDHDEDTNKPTGAFVELLERAEQFVISPDRRHGKNGYRVQRFLPEDQDSPRWCWDQWYQFHVSLGDFATAVAAEDYEHGVKAF